MSEYQYVNINIAMNIAEYEYMNIIQPHTFDRMYRYVPNILKIRILHPYHDIYIFNDVEYVRSFWNIFKNLDIEYSSGTTSSDAKTRHNSPKQRNIHN